MFAGADLRTLPSSSSPRRRPQTRAPGCQPEWRITADGRRPESEHPLRTMNAPIFRCAAAALALLSMPICATAQELEPGAYWPLPTGLNIVTAVNSYNWGDLAFDPSAPIDEASASINTTAFSFTRAFGLAGRSANAGVMVPVVGGHVEGLYLGEPAEVDRFGLGDPRLRFAMNLYGAPAMTPKALCVVQPAGHRGRQRHGRGAARAIRSGQADQPRHQSLVDQAGAWYLAHLRPVGGGGHGGGLVLHRQHRLPRRTHAGAGSDYRRAGPPHLQVQAHHVAGRGCQLLYRGDGRRSAACRTSTSSAIHASARRFPRRSVAARPFAWR